MWNPTIFNIICLVAGTNDSSTKRLMFQALFFFIISYWLKALKTLYLYKKNWKLKQFFQRILQEIEKKIILGTSDPWSMSRLSQRPSSPVYYFEFLVLVWLNFVSLYSIVIVITQPHKFLQNYFVCLFSLFFCTSKNLLHFT